LLFSKIKVGYIEFKFLLKLESFFFFALMQKRNKKNQSAAADEILNISLKSRNSPAECFSLKDLLAQTALIF
jgi:hypothetical protein